MKTLKQIILWIMYETRTCTCGRRAMWIHVPMNEPYCGVFCDHCVPRGCSCNYEYSMPGAYGDDIPELYDGISPPTDRSDWIWIKEGEIWANVDERGRLEPCCEYVRYDD